MRRVIIESPYAGRSKNPIVAFFQCCANRRYARRALRDSLGRGEAPLASHLLYTQRGVLNDQDPVERSWGIGAGHVWIEQADAVVFYLDRGISQGMRAGETWALDRHIPVETRYLDWP